MSGKLAMTNVNVTSPPEFPWPNRCSLANARNLCRFACAAREINALTGKVEAISAGCGVSSKLSSFCEVVVFIYSRANTTHLPCH